MKKSVKIIKKNKNVKNVKPLPTFLTLKSMNSR